MLLFLEADTSILLLKNISIVRVYYFFLQWFYSALFLHDLHVMQASVLTQGSNFYCNGDRPTAYRVHVYCVLKSLLLVHDGDDV